MSIPDDPSIPVFTYVGRLKDSRKGLELFLDALAILWESDPLYAFKAWVIGGNDRDKAWSLSSAATRPSLRCRISSGDLTFWGRIDGSALPEFYSRSSALIVPSFREQFCITAVEAMMCGCPVIAARVGGLQDVVVGGRTGHLFDRGNSTSLVAVMASYLRAPSLPRWLGANASFWARTVFDANVVNTCLEEVLRDPASYECKRWLGESEAHYRELAIREAIPKIERMLEAEGDSFEDLTSSHSLSFSVLLKDRRKVFVKLYSNKPTFFSSTHRIPFPGESSRLPRERILMALHLRGQSFFPPVIAYDLEAGVMIQEYSKPIPHTSFDEVRGTLRAAIRLLRSFDPAPETASLRDKINEKLAEYTEPNFVLMEELDRLSAELHAHLIGDSLRTRQLHPQLELLRIGKFLELNAFLLPKDYVARAQAAVLFLLSVKPLVPALPVFAHGTLKAEHLLSGSTQLRLCDFDHSGYFCGPIDVAHWIWDYFSFSSGNHPGVMLRKLAEELEDELELYMSICWVLTFQLNRDFAFFSLGDFQRTRSTLGFLYEFSEAVRDAFATLSKGI